MDGDVNSVFIEITKTSLLSVMLFLSFFTPPSCLSNYLIYN